MTTWFLIFYLATANPVPLTLEFDTGRACEVALQQLKNKADENRYAFFGICAPKAYG